MERKIKTPIQALLCILLVLMTTASHASIHTSPASHSHQPKLEELVVARAVVYEKNPKGQIHPKCVVNTSGRPDLVPGFADAAPSGFASRVRFHTAQSAEIPECDAEIQANLALSTESQVLAGTQLAAVTLAIACIYGGVLGLVKASSAALTASAGMGAYTGMFLVFETGSKLNSLLPTVAGSVAVGVITGAAVSVACQTVSQFAVEYLFEAKR